MAKNPKDIKKNSKAAIADASAAAKGTVTAKGVERVAP